MEELKQHAGAMNTRLDEIVSLAKDAADTIERLRTEVQRREQRIRQLEEAEAALKHAAERYWRMKAHMEAQPAAKGGFSAHGTTYPTFDEAFDVAYPGSKSAEEK